MQYRHLHSAFWYRFHHHNTIQQCDMLNQSVNQRWKCGQHGLLVERISSMIRLKSHFTTGIMTHTLWIIIDNVIIDDGVVYLRTGGGGRPGSFLEHRFMQLHLSLKFHFFFFLSQTAVGGSHDAGIAWYLLVCWWPCFDLYKSTMMVRFKAYNNNFREMVKVPFLGINFGTSQINIECRILMVGI